MRRYSLEQGIIDDHIMNLIQICGGSPDSDLIKEIIVTALKLVEQPADRGDIKILDTSIRELRFAFRLFSAYRNVRKVTVFGSARTHEDDPAYKQAAGFSQLMAENGYMVITGAGEGIMKGAQEGAGRKMSFGVNIQLPFEQNPNVFIENDPKLVSFKYFFTRKLIFMKEADAIALFEGGYGTLDEAFEALTLMQTGKGDILPVVMVDSDGHDFWREWQHRIETKVLGEGLISPEDIRFFKVTDDVNEAVQEILLFYRNYHSCRYVRESLIIRHKIPIDGSGIERLNMEFKDIVERGSIESSPAFPEEGNEPEFAQMPRLAFRFNRKNFGRLRQFIDVINMLGTPSKE